MSSSNGIWVINLTWLTVTHERTLVWTQKDSSKTAVARIVGVSGDPAHWVINRTATTRYITAPNPSWTFEALAMDFQRKTLYWSDTGSVAPIQPNITCIA